MPFTPLTPPVLAPGPTSPERLRPHAVVPRPAPAVPPAPAPAPAVEAPSAAIDEPPIARPRVATLLGE